MTERPVSHDQNFKNLILDYPREALEFFAPKEAALVPADAVITPLREELLKKRLPEGFYETDVPLRIDWPNKECEAVIFCIEENSAARSEEDLLIRHAIYSLMLSREHKTRRVIPVAVHPFDKTPPSDFLELKGNNETYLQFKAITTTLLLINARDCAKSKNRVELLCMPLMRYTEAEKLEIVEACVDGYFENELDPEKRKKYTQFFYTYMRLEPHEYAKLRDEIAKRSARVEEFMSLRDLMIEEGEAIGLVKGEAKGAVREVLALYKKGRLTLTAAREELNDLAVNGEITAEKLKEAIAELPRE